MHSWGDDWFEKHGKDFSEAQHYIYDFTKRWSRCNLSFKEKYGTIRYEWIFPPYGAIYYRNPIHRFWVSSWLYYKWEHFGWYVCGLALQRAVKKWPQFETELCCDFIPNTKFGRQCEAKYWK